MYRLLDSLFGPLARLLVARGVVFADTAERLKLNYVRAAAKSANTDSRISVMTGLQRRDVARLRTVPDQKPTASSPLSRIIALWLSDEAYQGRPIARRGGCPSFDALAQAVARDVHPRTFLEQLIAAGSVRLDDEDRVFLLVRSYQPLAGTADQIDYFARNGGDFLQAGTDNILTENPPHFERAVHYNNLSETAVAKLDAAFRSGQMALLQDINTLAAKLAKSDAGTLRFRAGGYFYSTDEKDN